MSVDRCSNNNNKHAYAGIQWLFYTSKSPIGTPGSAALRPSLTSVVEGRGCPPSEMTCGWLLALAGTGKIRPDPSNNPNHICSIQVYRYMIVFCAQNTYVVWITYVRITYVACSLCITALSLTHTHSYATFAPIDLLRFETPSRCVMCVFSSPLDV